MLVEQDDSVDMVWHDDECICLDGREALGQLPPDPPSHPPGLTQPHLVVTDFAKQAQPLMHRDGHEIRANLCVVIRLQAE